MSNTDPTHSDPCLQASWQRSDAYGLDASAPLPDTALSRPELMDRLEANARLLTFARPILENLHHQLASRGSMVLLADRQGLILNTVGDTDFVGRAARVALAPGASWDEAQVGTNAVGTALATGRTVAIHGPEHYLERNRFLTCIATPIYGPTGGTLGILDVSADARAMHASHARALLRTSAGMIEHRLLEGLDNGFLRLYFHPRAELLGTSLEGLALFDEEGWLIAANRHARSLLLHQAEQLFRPHCQDCFATAWPGLVSQAAQGLPQPFPLATFRGAPLSARATLRRSPAPRPPDNSTGISPIDPLAELCGNDQALRKLHASLVACTDPLRPLLLTGEPGSGRRHFARTVHESQRTASAPFVEVSAAGQALSTLLDALSAPHGPLDCAGSGTLFLNDLGDLSADALPHLLHALQTSCRAIDCRAICALPSGTRTSAVQEGLLLELPPLRQREDFDLLVRAFVRTEFRTEPVYVGPDTLAALRHHTWPGNLRELHTTLRLTLALMGDDARQMCPEDVASAFQSSEINAFCPT